ncbi:MAG TPA: hypothetical protein VM432_10270, partial [Bdellovibrionales bacterium]|nr:hypothetical protein [Bdellovibrionales bacterium]
MGRWTKNHLGLDNVRFETSAGMVDVSVKDEQVASHLGFVKASLREITAEVAGKQVRATLVNTGVPHAVVRVDELEGADTQKELISAFRFHPAAGPRGANVTFLQVVGRAKVRTKTFERGVEGFTLSCGTGVIAAAAVCLKEQGGLRAEVWTPGGELVAEFGSDFTGVTLIGPAVEVFETTISEEILK